MHDFVNGLKQKFADEIHKYIESVFDDVIDNISIQHNIDRALIYDTLHSTLEKSLKKCTIVTKMGHNCKYNAKENNDYCIKHYNMYVSK